MDIYVKVLWFPYFSFFFFLVFNRDCIIYIDFTRIAFLIKAIDYFTKYTS